VNVKGLYFCANDFKTCVHRFNYLAEKTVIRFYKYLLCPFMVLLFLNSALSQNQNKVDSLLNVLKTAKEDTSKVKLLNRLSALYCSNNPPIGLKYATEALNLSIRIKWLKGEAASNYCLGWSQIEIPKQLEYFLKAVEILEQHPEIKDTHGDPFQRGDPYQAVGSVYKGMGDYDKALKYFFLARKYYLEFDKNSGRALSSISDVYYHQKNYPEALKYVTQSSLGYPNGSIINMIRIGKIYMMQQKYAEADSFVTMAIKLSREKNDQRNLGIGLHLLARVYLLEVNDHYPIKENPKTHLKKAVVFAQESERIFKNISNYDFIEVYEVLVDLSLALQDYKAAVKYYELLLNAKEKIYNETSSQQLAALQTKYDTEKKDNEITLLNKDKEIQLTEIKKQTLLKNSFIGGLGFTLVLFFFIYSNYRTRQKLKLETIRNNIAADLHDDIGSTLNSISLFSEVAKKEAGKPIPALDQIGVSARKIIDAMGDIVWTINPENDIFENVIARMRSLAYLLLKAKGIEFVFKAEEGLNQLSLPMLARKNVYLLFKEAINNLVKYSNASRANFHITLENKNVKMIIRDNGAGFDMENAKMGNGIKNMKRRAAEIGAQFLIESAEGKGTNIELSFKA
jgi:signal transduction histidine kinase